jgi:hypothetical protein
VSLHEMNTCWTLGDLADAHLALDVRDELAAKGRPRPRA